MFEPICHPFKVSSRLFRPSFQHLYPKSQIDVHVTVLEDDGSADAAAITCAGLALANASIKMYDLIVGASSVSRETTDFYIEQTAGTRYELEETFLHE